MAALASPRISDNHLLRVFVNEVLQKHEEIGLTAQAKVTVQVNHNMFTLTADGISDNGETPHELLEKMRNSQSYCTSIIAITLADAGLHQHFRFQYRRNDGSLIDKIELGNGQVDENHLIIFDSINKKLTRSLANKPDSNISEEIFSAHHEVLTKLEGFSASLIDQQVQRSHQVEQDKQKFVEEESDKFIERTEKLEAGYQSKSKQLEENYSQRKGDLDERQELIEDADNTTARRKTTTAMLEDVKDKAKLFNFSESVRSRNNATKILSALLAFTGLVSVVAALWIQSGDSWFMYTRVFLGSALFVSSILYLIKWYNSWANRIAQQELENQQFVRDLNRAHLAVEMCLEWNEKKDGEIPTRLLDSLTEGLFQDKNQVQQDVTHPAEQLASALVRSADKISIPLGSSHMEVSGRNLGKRKVKQETQHSTATQ